MNALRLQQCVAAMQSDDFFPPEHLALLAVCGLFFLMGLVLTFSASIKVAQAVMNCHRARRLIETQAQEIILLRHQLRTAQEQQHHKA